jgi:hypothetical protein
MTTATYTFDHRMDRDYTVTREVTLTVRRGGVVQKRFGKSRFYRARFPRLLARQMARRLRSEGLLPRGRRRARRVPGRRPRRRQVPAVRRLARRPRRRLTRNQAGRRSRFHRGGGPEPKSLHWKDKRSNE